TQNRHLPLIGGVTLAKHLDKPVTNHPMANNNNLLVHEFYTATSFLELEIGSLRDPDASGLCHTMQTTMFATEFHRVGKTYADGARTWI
uniref:hypothetical protein n=1 Tax=Mycobacteroides chelonae TaxID=1774 RepID=UPI0012FFCA5D